MRVKAGGQIAGGISTSQWGWDKTRYNGLSERAANFINDILAVAETLGWASNDTVTNTATTARAWESNKSQAFTATSGMTIMEVRAFQNGNLHIKFNQKFMKKLNVEFGRLKGWLRNPAHAALEMCLKSEEAVEYFGSTFKLSQATTRLLLEGSAVVDFQAKKT